MTDQRPDIIFLMTDQQRWDALGVEDARVLTPHLDRIARHGVRYTGATCQAPMCVPSRFSLMTGLYPSQSGVRANWWSTPDDDELPVRVLPEVMRDAGYLTAGFGKTHWGTTAHTPSTRGFDVRVVGDPDLGLEDGATHWQHEDDPEGYAQYAAAVKDYGPGEEEPAGYVGTPGELPSRRHIDGWIAEKAVEWLEGPDLDTDQPLFFYLSFAKPHAAHIPPAEFQQLYDITDIPDLQMPPWDHTRYDHIRVRDENSPFLNGRSERWRTIWQGMSSEQRRLATLRYWANCTWLDSLFGEAMERLERRGRLRNALIVFVSDHGELLGERFFHFSKYCLYDSSVRVPLVLSGTALPATLRGTVDPRPTEILDLYATLSDVAGAGGNAPGHPSRSLLTGPARRGSFAEMHEPAPAWMWRTERHKLIYFVDPAVGTAQGELYDLVADPNEWVNIYEDPQSASIRDALVRDLIAHVSTTFGAWPVHRSDLLRSVPQTETLPAHTVRIDGGMTMGARALAGREE
ncbi:sulfatase-like hydrolase/transferase [Microbacterium aquimaris]|uniref:sulfatase family protein n=1 Tax=Microbacterium aquimaris TaxID=459816 RepID=UPI002AD40FC5|nr:sulfatase-like hydrolase/transferase [Microbacterium aquimaris]MDZ8275251.1 sulfatase-like hydrolase/transferase [Microbacterium aquimaris]